MVRPMQAVTFSNELVVRSILARMPDLSMRYVEGVDLKTPIYLACADWQNGTETHQLLCKEIRNLSLPNAP
ncbi:MAG: hypothetical protein CR958_00475 [Rhodobacterales bacterium]|nr:MAG: hypothetical protein CR958_00475 [Rhodobacterales bacterium]